MRAHIPASHAHVYAMADSTDCDLGKLLAAVNFAAVKHKDQRRKDAGKSPYINHPIGVAYLLWKEGGVTDLATLQARHMIHTCIGCCHTSRALGRKGM